MQCGTITRAQRPSSPSCRAPARLRVDLPLALRQGPGGLVALAPAGGVARADAAVAAARAVVLARVLTPDDELVVRLVALAALWLCLCTYPLLTDPFSLTLADRAAPVQATLVHTPVSRE